MHRQVLYVHCMVEAAGVGKSRGLCGTVVLIRSIMVIENIIIESPLAFH